MVGSLRRHNRVAQWSRTTFVASPEGASTKTPPEPDSPSCSTTFERGSEVPAVDDADDLVAGDPANIAECVNGTGGGPDPAPSPLARLAAAGGRSPRPSDSTTSRTTTVMLSLPPSSLAALTSSSAVCEGLSPDPRILVMMRSSTSLLRPSEHSR